MVYSKRSPNNKAKKSRALCPAFYLDFLMSYVCSKDLILEILFGASLGTFRELAYARKPSYENPQGLSHLLIIIFVIIRRIFKAIGLISQHRFTEGQRTLSLNSGFTLPSSFATVTLGFRSLLLWNRHEPARLQNRN